jgi:hypothetical protein
MSHVAAMAMNKQVFLLFFLCLSPAFARLLQHHTASNITNEQFEATTSSHHRSLALSKSTEPYFTTRLIERKFGFTSPCDVHIKIFNHAPDKWYSVTVVSDNMYTGSATFLRRVDDRPGNPLLYSWTPVLSGDYEIIVHELGWKVGDYTPPLMGDVSTFSVVDKAGFDSRLFVVQEIERMPPCSTVERWDLYTHWDGIWIGVR